MAGTLPSLRRWLLSPSIIQRLYLPVPPVAMFPCKLSTEPVKDELYRQITVEVKGHNPAVLKSYEQFTRMAATELGVKLENIYDPPKFLEKRSLLRSVFVHKKHFRQYEQRTHYKIFDFKHLTGSTASTFLEYIQRNLPEGMAMKVTKYELHPVPEHLKPPTPAPSETSDTSTSA